MVFIIRSCGRTIICTEGISKQNKQVEKSACQKRTCLKAIRNQAKSKVILYPSTALGSTALTEERFKELMEMMKQKQNREVEAKFVDKLDDVKTK